MARQSMRGDARLLQWASLGKSYHDKGSKTVMKQVATSEVNTCRYIKRGKPNSQIVYLKGKQSDTNIPALRR